eukprot:3362567-Pyramimonas_sp.AAC.1
MSARCVSNRTVLLSWTVGSCHGGPASSSRDLCRTQRAWKTWYTRVPCSVLLCGTCILSDACMATRACDFEE